MKMNEWNECKQQKWNTRVSVMGNSEDYILEGKQSERSKDNVFVIIFYHIIIAVHRFAPRYQNGNDEQKIKMQTRFLR